MPFVPSRMKSTPVEIAPGFVICADRSTRIPQTGTDPYNERLSREIARFQGRAGAPARSHIQYGLTVEKDGNYYLSTHDGKFVLASHKQGEYAVVPRLLGSHGISRRLDEYAGYQTTHSGKFCNDYVREVLAEQYLRYAFAKSTLTSLGLRNAICMEAALESRTQEASRSAWNEAHAKKRAHLILAPKLGRPS